MGKLKTVFTLAMIHISPRDESPNPKHIMADHLPPHPPPDLHLYHLTPRHTNISINHCSSRHDVGSVNRLTHSSPNCPITRKLINPQKDSVTCPCCHLPQSLFRFYLRKKVSVSHLVQYKTTRKSIQMQHLNSTPAKLFLLSLEGIAWFL